MSEKITGWNVDAISQALTKAGAIARDDWDDPQVSIKSDNSVVTEADVKIERHFEELFDHPEDGSYLLGEETHEHHDDDYFEKALAGSAWVVDPIDGTTSYAAGLPNWGISIGKMDRGVITEGALYLPRLGTMLISDSGVVYFGRTSVEDPEARKPEFSPLSATSRGSDDRGVLSLSQKFLKEGRYSGINPVQATGSCVWSTFHIATGSFIAYIGTVKLWDIAGSFGVLAALDHYFGFPDGRRITNDVTDEIYELDLSHKRPWRLRGHFIVARSEKTAQAVLGKVSFDK